MYGMGGISMSYVVESVDTNFTLGESHLKNTYTKNLKLKYYLFIYYLYRFCNII
jgi:hypothetical protein